MQKKISPAEVLEAVSGATTSTRWFRDTPHRWATASLPLAYAVACIEEVCRKSDEARDVYQRITESWGKPGVKAMGEAMISEVPPSAMNRAKNALIHPETELLPNPNKPFRELEEMFAGLEISDEFVDELLAVLSALPPALRRQTGHR